MSVDRRRPPRLLGVAVAFEGCLVLVAFVSGRLLDLPVSEQIHLGWGGFAWGVTATVPLLLGLAWGLRSRWPPAVGVAKTVREIVVPLFAGSSVLALAVISVLAGIGEEALFRGVLQGVLADRLTPLLALVITSVVFGLVHLVTPQYAILAGVIGLYLGTLTLLLDNLFIPIVVHALYDFLALTYLTRNKLNSGDAVDSVMAS